MTAVKVEFRIGYAGLPASVSSSSSTSLGGWEVTVAYDPAHCVIHCLYRRTREATLLKPIISIRIDPGSGSLPRTVIVDPAGLGIPSVMSEAVRWPEKLCLPGASWTAAMPLPAAGRLVPAAIPARDGFLTTHALATKSPALPLRI
jgi:hypothetical protein